MPVLVRTEDGPLPGGTANRGRVVRIGDTVHRPRGAHTPAVHDLLRHLADRGFTGVPRVVDLQQDTEVLDYVEGRAATEPLAQWALRRSAVVSVGALLRRYHDQAQGFDGSERQWQRQVPEPWRGALITHNDLNPANVIFRGGRAVALIDFDLAAPGCAAWDLAVTACFWAPLRAPGDITDSRAGHVLDRFRDLLDGYGADTELRRDVAAACADANDWNAAIIHDASLRGHPAFGRVWAAQAQMYERAAEWLRVNTGELAGVAH